MAKFLTLRNCISTVLALAIAIAVFAIFDQYLHKNVARVVVHGVFLADTRIDISSVDDVGNVRLVDSILAQAEPEPTPILVGTRYINAPIDKLRLSFYSSQPRSLDSPQHPGFGFHSIQIVRPYAPEIFVGANLVDHQFDLSTDGQVKKQARMGSEQLHNVLTSKESLTPDNHFKAVLLAALFFFGFWFIFRNGDWANVPAWADMSLGREISTSHEFGAINGIRGIAALLVLLSHTAPGFETLGVGLTVLFVISGFLLSKPFVLSPSRIYSLNNFETYLTKRLKRILPMYYLYIFMLYVVSLQLDTALRHFLFVEAEGHLWPMTQIFSFYLLLPFVLLITSALYRIHVIVPILALAYTGYWWLANMGEWTPFFNGTYFHEFYLYAFLFGVAAAYLHYGWLYKSQRLASLFQRLRWPLAVIGFVVFTLTIAWSAPVTPPDWAVPYMTQFYVKCILSILIILFALNIRGTAYNWFISNWFFRSMGIVGFSFYILHGLGIKIVLTAQEMFLGLPDPSHRSWELFFGSLAVTYFMSLITYSYVERPFFGFKKIRSS